MSRNSFFFLAFLSILLFFFSFVGCQDENSGGEVNGSLPKIIVEPQDSVDVGYFEQVEFVVRLENADGNPMVNEPVSVNFIGLAGNSRLDPASFNTDIDGKGTVTFRAPDNKTEFQIRFSAPSFAEETWKFVGVHVIPELVGLALNVTYEGNRQIGDVDAVLYEEISCSDLTREDAFEPIATKKIEAGLPASLTFFSLRDDLTYTIQLHGRDATGEVRASTCLGDLSPNLNIVNLELLDVPLEISENYYVTTTIEADGVLDAAVDLFVWYFYEYAIWYSLNSGTNGAYLMEDPANAIIDKIKEILVTKEPIAVEPFENLVTQNSIHDSLTNYFTDNSIDIEQSLEPLWGMINSNFTTVTAYSELELGVIEEGIHPFYHQIERVDFSDNKANIISYFVEAPETVQGTSILDTEDPYLLHIDKHTVNLGLGDPIHQILKRELDDLFGVQRLSLAVESIIDCDQIADMMVPDLQDVVDRNTIYSGCLDATNEVEMWAYSGIILLNSFYSQLILEGTCYFENPAVGNQAKAIKDGVFSVIWKGPVNQYRLGPMDASFQAQIATAR